MSMNPLHIGMDASNTTSNTTNITSTPTSKINNIDNKNTSIWTSKTSSLFNLN